MDAKSVSVFLRYSFAVFSRTGIFRGFSLFIIIYHVEWSSEAAIGGAAGVARGARSGVLMSKKRRVCAAHRCVIRPITTCM
jgi:hypothetical protein